MAKCKNCGETDKTWLQGDNGKWQLLNADGSRHYCLGGGSTTTTGTGGTGGGGQQQQQQSQAQQFTDKVQVELLAKMNEDLKKIADQMERQSVFYEGLVGEMQAISKSVHKAFLIADKADQFLEQSRITDAKIDRLVAYFKREEELAKQEEAYDQDKEDGTLGLA